jgi:hypothetical protein
MKKNYVYKLNVCGWIFGDLKSAVSGAYADMLANEQIKIGRPDKHSNLLSRPVVTKKHGGYKVTCINHKGKAYSRTIDVFVPECIGAESCHEYEELRRVNNPYDE